MGRKVSQMMQVVYMVKSMNLVLLKFLGYLRVLKAYSVQSAMRSTLQVSEFSMFVSRWLQRNVIIFRRLGVVFLFVFGVFIISQVVTMSSWFEISVRQMVICDAGLMKRGRWVFFRVLSKMRVMRLVLVSRVEQQIEKAVFKSRRRKVYIIVDGLVIKMKVMQQQRKTLFNRMQQSFRFEVLIIGVVLCRIKIFSIKRVVRAFRQAMVIGFTVQVSF